MGPGRAQGPTTRTRAQSPAQPARSPSLSRAAMPSHVLRQGPASLAHTAPTILAPQPSPTSRQLLQREGRSTCLLSGESQCRLHPRPRGRSRQPAGARPFGAHRSKGQGVNRGLLQGACSIFMPTLGGHRMTAAHLSCSLTFRGHKTQGYLGATPQALKKWAMSLPLSVKGPHK